MTNQLLLTQDQALTILYELKETKAQWAQITSSYDEVQSFEEGIERFCEGALAGTVIGWSYFADDCCCFYGNLSPRPNQYFPYDYMRNREIYIRSEYLSQCMFTHIYGEMAVGDSKHPQHTYIEQLLGSRLFVVGKGVSVLDTDQENRSARFLRELYCLCYSSCREEWRDAHPLTEDLDDLTQALHTLTDGLVLATYCGYHY